jgi:hypothetical protein
MVVHWKDNSCLGKGTGPCNKCKTAALGSITGVCLGLVTTLLRIRNCMRRGKSKNDRYCYKSFAMFLGCFGIFSDTSALVAFAEGCVL